MSHQIYFLKTNAIVPINDAFGECIKNEIHLREQEENPDRKAIDDLKRYLWHKKTLESEMGKTLRTHISKSTFKQSHPDFP